MTREQVAEVASHLFRQNGYERTSLAAIADAIGVTGPALYWHFESKADILFEFLRSTLEAFNQTFRDVLEGFDDPTDRLRMFAETHARIQLESKDTASAYGELVFSHSQLTRSLGQEQVELLSELQRTHYRLGKSIIVDGSNRGLFDVANATAATFAIINMCEYVNSWYTADGSLTIDAIAELHGAFALRLVGAHV